MNWKNWLWVVIVIVLLVKAPSMTATWIHEALHGVGAFIDGLGLR